MTASTHLALRPALPSDAATIAYHRHPDGADEPHRATYAAWVAGAIGRGQYLGWFLELGGAVLAGAGLTLLEWGPARDSANPWRARLSNVFTEPAWRRQGLARQLVAHCLAEAQARGLEHLNLSTTLDARGLYEAFGFRMAENEMRWQKR